VKIILLALHVRKFEIIVRTHFELIHILMDRLKKKEIKRNKINK
jgi:hypothetical protein